MANEKAKPNRTPPPIRRCLAVVLCAAVLLATLAAAAEPPPRVYVIVVDGLPAEAVGETLTPSLWKLVHGGNERATFYPRARAVMPTVTNTNHVSMMTGAYPAAHGIVGNSYWDRGAKAQRNHLETSALIEVETLFTVLHGERPKLATAGIFGKRKLTDLFGGSAKQQAPTALWGDRDGDLGADERTIDELERTIARDDPKLAFVNLGDVDRISHVFGPQSGEARKAIREADRLLGRLVRFLESTGVWPNVVLFVTADHNFAAVEACHDPRHPAVLFGRELAAAGLEDLFTVSNGGVASVYLRDVEPQAALRPEQQERLRTARALALKQPQIAEALYRLPNPADGGAAHTIDAAHPEWRLAHPRVGELLLVAKPGCFFNDPYSSAAASKRGGHGGPGELRIPILVTGGWAKIRHQIVETEPQAENPDLGMTAAWLLGVRAPRRIDGQAVAPKLLGRVLTEAFEP